MPWSRRRRVVLATDLPCVGLRAVIYVQPEDGDRGSDVELAVRDNLDFGPGRSQVVTVAIPRVGEIAGPCYLSCRATTGSGEVRVDNYFSRGRENSVMFIVTCPFCYRALTGCARGSSARGWPLLVTRSAPRNRAPSGRTDGQRRTDVPGVPATVVVAAIAPARTLPGLQRADRATRLR